MDLRPTSPASVSPTRWSVVGRGRVGTSVARALRGAGAPVTGPHGRGHDGAGADAVLLCVPDDAVASAARTVGPGPAVGHCSGATDLTALRPHPAFSLHPLMTIAGASADLTGAPCAVAGDGERTAGLAAELAHLVGMRPFGLRDADRAAYHAAASVAANHLLAVEDLAERLLATAGLERELLVPLVEAAVRGWATAGAAPALTGPVARGDTETVAAQRNAVAARMDAGDLALFDALNDAVARLADEDRDVAWASPLATPAGGAA